MTNYVLEACINKCKNENQENFFFNLLYMHIYNIQKKLSYELLKLENTIGFCRENTSEK